VQEALLHAVVGADLLQNVPGKLPVQLVGKRAHDDGDDADDGRDGNEEGLAQRPHVPVLLVGLDGSLFQQAGDRIVNLVDLENGVDENGQVGHAQADDLNRVLEPQSVPCQEQDVEEAEDKQRQERRDGAVLRLEAVGDVRVVLVHETELEPPKHVSALSMSALSSSGLARDIGDSRLESHAGRGLQGDDEEEELGPF